MKPSYDLKKLKVKRRGLLSELKNQQPIDSKIRITISLDKDIIEHFKAEASVSGALPYQTQINQALRKLLSAERGDSDPDIEEIKFALLHDAAFIRKLSKILHKRA
jgi:uncharacterized protein (DUF4415 family)